MSSNRIWAARLIAGLALMAGAPAADAAPPWSAPTPLPDSVPQLYSGGSVVAQNGMTLFHDGALFPGRLVWLGADGGLARVQRLSDPLAAAPIEASPNRFALLRMRRKSQRVQLQLGFVNAGDEARRFDTVATYAPATDGGNGATLPAAIAADRGGRIAIAWSERRLPGRKQDPYGPPTFVRLVIRHRDGTFTRRMSLARRAGFGVGPTALAFDRRGALVAVFGAVNKRRGTGASLLARTLGRRGRLSRPRRIGEADGSWGTDLRAASGPDGTIALAWGSRTASECYPIGEKVVRAAVRPARTRTFRRASTLGTSPVTSCESRKVDVVVGPDGRTTVGWSLWESRERRAVRVATFDANGSLASNEALGIGDFGDLVPAPDGGLLATWDDAAGPNPADGTDSPWGGSGPEGATQGHAMAALRLPGAERFGIPETVSSEREDTGPPLGAATGVFRLLWFSYQLGDQPPGSQPVGSMHTASRPLGP